MGIVIRQSAKTVLLSYAGFALGYINTLLLFPLVLSKEQIGLVRLVINISVFFATFASLGSPNIPNRYFFYFKDEKEQHHGLLFFLLTLGTIGYALFIAVFMMYKETIIGFYSGNAFLLVRYIPLILPFTLIMTYHSIFDAYTVIQQRPVYPNFLKELFIRILATVGLVFLMVKLITFPSFVIYTVCTYGIMLLALIWYLKKEKLLFLKPNWHIFRHKAVPGMLLFAGFVLLINLSNMIIANIDSLVLAAYKGLATTGVYTIAFFIAAVIEIPKRSLSQAAIPIISECNKNNDIEKLTLMYKKSSLNQLIAGGLIFFLVWYNIGGIFRLIPNGAGFLEGKWVVFWLMLGKLFDMATGLNQEIVGTSRYYKFELLFCSTLAGLGIFFNLLFIPLFGINGAAFSAALAIFILNIIRFIFIKFVFKIQPFSWNTLKVFIPVGAVILLNYLLPVLHNFIVDGIVRSIMILVSFSALVVLFKISEDINKIVFKVWDSIRVKFG